MAYSTNFIKYHPNIKDKLDTKKSKIESLTHYKREYKLLWPFKQQFDNTFKIKMCVS